MTRNGLSIGILGVLDQYGVQDLPSPAIEEIMRLCDGYTAAILQKAVGRISDTLSAVITEVQSNGLAELAGDNGG